MCWTAEDIEYLYNFVGLKNHQQLSKELDKSIESIKKFQWRHGIKFLENVYTYSLLAKELGCSRGILRVYYEKGWLKGHRASWKCIWGTAPMIFTEQEIARFLKKYPQALANRVFPNLFFRSIRNG